MLQGLAGVVMVIGGMVAPGDGELAFLLPGLKLFQLGRMLVDPPLGNKEGYGYGILKALNEGFIESLFKPLLGGGAQVGRDAHAAVLVSDAVVADRPGGYGGLCEQSGVAGTVAGVPDGSDRVVYGCLEGIGIDHETLALAIEEKRTDHSMMTVAHEGWGRHIVSDVPCPEGNSEKNEEYFFKHSDALYHNKGDNLTIP